MGTANLPQYAGGLPIAMQLSCPERRQKWCPLVGPGSLLQTFRLENERVSRSVIPALVYWQTHSLRRPTDHIQPAALAFATGSKMS